MFWGSVINSKFKDPPPRIAQNPLGVINHELGPKFACLKLIPFELKIN